MKSEQPQEAMSDFYPSPQSLGAQRSFDNSPAESFLSLQGDNYPSLFGETINPLAMMSPAASSSETCDASSPAPTDKAGEEQTSATAKEDQKSATKPTKKRKSWGQPLPEPKTNLPPRKRAKTADEKEQRRVERVLRNRRAAQSSRERKRLEQEQLEKENLVLKDQVSHLQGSLARALEIAQQLARQNGHAGISPSDIDFIYNHKEPAPTVAPALFQTPEAEQEEATPVVKSEPEDQEAAHAAAISNLVAFINNASVPSIPAKQTEAKSISTAPAPAPQTDIQQSVESVKDSTPKAKAGKVNKAVKFSEPKQTQTLPSPIEAAQHPAAVLSNDLQCQFSMEEQRSSGSSLQSHDDEGEARLGDMMTEDFGCFTTEAADTDLFFDYNQFNNDMILFPDTGDMVLDEHAAEQHLAAGDPYSENLVSV